MSTLRFYPLVLLLFLAACDGGPKVGTRVGSESFQREIFFEIPKLGEIRSILLTSSKQGGDITIAVCGLRGAAFFTGTGVCRGSVGFEESAYNPRLIDLDGDGSWEFMNRGWGWSPVALLDSGGRLRWKYPPEKSDGAPDAMAAGDLDGDGHLEFVVGMNAGGGLRVLNDQGRELWRRDASNVFSVEMVDVDHDGRLEIIHSHGSRILIRDSKGLALYDGST